MKRHTPGPWQWFLDGGAISSGATYGPNYADCVWGPKGPGHGIIADCSPHGQPATEETIANAVLIVAAPDLLDALERLVHMAECNTTPGPNTLAQARAAIAKAYGKEDP